MSGWIANNCNKKQGIEFLRILAMFMIVMLHLLRHGGVVENVQQYSLNFHITWLLEAICYSSVNIYALISGFVLCEKKFRLSRMISLWLSIVFYMILILLIMFVIGKEPISLNNLVNAILPITKHQYWYLTSYFGLLLLTPFLNKAFVFFEKKEIILIIILGFLFVSILPSVFYSDPFYMHGGFSTLWLCVLYLVGGGLKKIDLTSKIQPKWLVLTIVVTVGITYLSKIGLIYMFGKLNMQTNGCTFYSYISPTIIVMSIAIFCFFCNRTFSRCWVALINFFSPMTLGVYIIHTNPLIWKHFIENISSSFVNYNAFFFVVALLVFTVSIYVLCSIIDFIRIKFFDLLRLRFFAESFENRLMSLISHFCVTFSKKQNS